MNDCVKKLIEWCWENLEFYNSPDNWKDTYIVDIINNYKGYCYTKNGKKLTYNEIRNMFYEED